GRVKAQIGCAPQRALHVRQRDGRGFAQLLRPRKGLAKHAIVGHDAVAESPFEATRGRDALAECGQLERTTMTDALRELPAHAPVRHEADLLEWHLEERALAHYDQVAGEHVRRADAGGTPVDRRDAR